MTNNVRRRLAVLGAAFAVGCSGGEPATPPEQVGSVHQNWWIVGPGLHPAPLTDKELWASGGYAHPNQVREALGFLKGEVRKELALWAGRVDTNPASVSQSAYHFDNCQFSKSTELLREHYDVILSNLDAQAYPYAKDKAPWKIAMERLGFVFHAVQDFYAHSNWVESGQTQLVDSGLGSWPVLSPWSQVGQGMRVVEAANNRLPAGTTATLVADAHLLNLQIGGVAQAGLMTGTHHNEDNGGGSACITQPQDPPLSMHHGDKLDCYFADVKKECDRRQVACSDPKQVTYSDEEKAEVDMSRRVCREIWRSTYLAKDHPPEVVALRFADYTQRKAWRDHAHDLAMQQTEHEFCRLVSLLDRKYPAQNGNKSGGQRLYDEWVADRAGADAACGGGDQPFVARTGDWALTDVQGSRLSVVDLNGDLYPDLVVRDGSDYESNFASGPQRVWLLQNDRQGHFKDVTLASGVLRGLVPGKNGAVRAARAASVFVFGDVDNDGDSDAFVGTPPYTPSGLIGTERSQLLLNDGTGRFSDSRALAGFNLIPSGATFIDYDRDGALDLFVPARARRANGAPGWLLRNRGSLQFTDQSVAAGLVGPVRFPSGSTSCDLNGDGHAELLIGGLQRGRNGLWQGSGGVFLERGDDSHFAADTNVSWQDMRSAQAYCSYVKLENAIAYQHVMQQQECNALPAGCPAKCTTFPCDATQPASPADVASCNAVSGYTGAAATRFGDALSFRLARDSVASRLGGNTVGTYCGDFDGDGTLDLLNVERRARAEGQSADATQILRTSSGSGDVVLTRLAPAGTGIELPQTDVDWVDDLRGAEAFDYDNDSKSDVLIVAGRSRLLRNTSSGGKVEFVPVAVPGLGRRQGAAVADFDRDGDLDVVAGDVGGVTFFENRPSATLNHWLAIQLIGLGSGHANRSAIGARVTVTLADGRRLVREVDGGHGPSGAQGDLVLHFGLGAQTTPMQVAVRWPGSPSAKILTLAPDKHYRYVEGDADAAILALP